MMYAGTKDGENYGFHLEKDNLTNYIEITEEEHMALLDGQSSGKVITFHEDGKPTLEDSPPPTTEELATAARAERDQKITAIEWRLSRYQQQLNLGVTTDDSAEWYSAALVYIQALRDVPEQSGFPEEITWPSLSGGL